MKISVKQHKNKQTVEITPNLENPALVISFANKLLKLQREMYREYHTQIKEFYKQYHSYLTMDSDPIIEFIDAVLNRLGEKWFGIFEAISDPLATHTTNEIADKTQMDYRKVGKFNPFLIDIDEEYEMKKTRAIESSISSQVNLIKSIPTKFHESILGDVMRTTAIGGDAQALFKKLSAISFQTKERIAFIANDQIMKATVLLDRQEGLAAGFNRGKWKKSVAGKTHRKSHAEADGKEFDLSKGCYIDGEYILPGEKPHCKCSFILMKTSRIQKNLT